MGEVVRNWFPEVIPTASIPRPLGYVIPAKYSEVVEALLRQGVAVGMFIQDETIEIEASEVKEVVPAPAEYLAHVKIVIERKPIAAAVREGDFYVSCGQAAAEPVPCLLEPESEYGLIRYWKFALVPQAGSVFAFFRVVKPQTLLLVPYKPWPR